MTLLRYAGRPVEQPFETTNISSTGVLFRSGVELAVGLPLEYELTLAPGLGMKRAVRLHCLGKVVRLTEEQGVAATIERYEFMRMAE